MDLTKSDKTTTSHQLKKLREKIPESKYADIIEKLLTERKKLYSKETIRSVLNGGQVNDEVLIAALDVLLEITQLRIKELRKNKFDLTNINF